MTSVTAFLKAFFPNLDQLDFLQEGWRLEHEDPLSTDTPIVYKGVVYNEMKGALSSIDYLFAQRAQNELFPGSTYANVSGGDPPAIVDLSWEQLRQFHADHYHPSNATFYSYGDLPLEHHLATVEANALSQFEKHDVTPSLPPQARWSAPRRRSGTCPPDAMAADPLKQTKVSVSYLLNSTADGYSTFVDQVVCSLLVDGPTAPFYKALIDGNLGSDFSSNTGYDSSTREASWSVGLQGLEAGSVEAVLETIQATLETVAADGFNADDVEALLHQVELAGKHQRTSFGLGLGMTALSGWNHGADPVANMRIDAMVMRLREEMAADRGYLQAWVDANFVQNQHRLTYTMSPAEEYHEQLAEEEAATLAKTIAGLTAEDAAEIAAHGTALLAAQDLADAGVDCLPLLQVSEIERVAQYHQVEQRTFTAAATAVAAADVSVPIQWSTEPTNGVAYFRSSISTDTIPADLRPYLPLFCGALTSLGTDALDYRELAQAVKTTTGGVRAGATIVADPSDPDAFRTTLSLSSHCLDRNIDHMFGLVGDIFASPRFTERDHLRTIVGMSASDLSSSIADSGHSFALQRAARVISPRSAVAEQYTGLGQVALMSELAGAKDMDATVEKLIAIGEHLLAAPGIQCSLTCGEQAIGAADAAMEGFLNGVDYGSGAGIAAAAAAAAAEPFVAEPANAFVELPVAVNFAARALPTVAYTHPDSAPLSVLATVMSSKFLHREIREKGGAYGGGAGHNNGMFSFYSYRDPHTAATLEAFDKSVAWAADGGMKDTDVDEAMLSIFQRLDAPVAPSARGSRLFSSGITDAMVQARRERLLDVNRMDLIRVAQQYLSPDRGVASTAILGTSTEADAFRDKEGWTVEGGDGAGSK